MEYGYFFCIIPDEGDLNMGRFGGSEAEEIIAFGGGEVPDQAFGGSEVNFGGSEVNFGGGEAQRAL